MSIVLMSETKKYFTTTLSEAEKLVAEEKEKHGMYVKSTSIDKKTKKEHDYFVVTIVVEYYRAKDLAIFE